MRKVFVIEKELNGKKLRIYSNGKIESFSGKNWHELTSKPGILKSGYKQIQVNINQKLYTASRVIAWGFLDFDINNPKLHIDHINRDSTDNKLSNLRIATHQQNAFNTNAKGYTKHDNKWQSRIVIDGKHIHLGCYATEDEAHQAYLLAKEKYHVF